MITLIEAKQFLRVDFEDDDGTIQTSIEAAVQHMASIGINTEAYPLPAPVRQAALLMVSHFWETRGLIEGDAPRLSPVFFRLIAPYREIAL